MDLCFLDTETLGLDPTAPIWEFAAIRVRPGMPIETREFTIKHEHYPGKHVYVARFREQCPELAADYEARYNTAHAYTERRAADAIHYITKGAQIVGCNPGFDLDSQRLTELLLRKGVKPEWHYHPIDTASMATGWLAGRGILPPPPWSSNQLSALIGVDPANYRRHTAMADARWCQAQYHRMMTSGPPKPVEIVEDWHGKAKVSQ